jgi:hypothetical protein
MNIFNLGKYKNKLCNLDVIGKYVNIFNIYPNKIELDKQINLD